MAVKGLVTCVVLMVMMMGQSVSGLTDEIAGYMTNSLSDTGIRLVLLWRQNFLQELENLEARLAEVEDKLQYAESVVPPYEEYVDQTMVDVNNKLAEAQAMFDSMTLPPVQNDTFVAFSTGDGSVSYEKTSSDTIKLNAPTLNTGHFDHVTGTFTAPRDGLYWFQTRTAPGSGIKFQLLRNGVDVLFASENNGLYDVKMRTAIVFLSAGDYVGLYPSPGQSAGTATLSSGLFFSGMLLNANGKLMPNYLAA